MSFLGFFGPITPPPQIEPLGTSFAPGIMNLVNVVLKFIILLGGLWAFINFIIAGFTFVTSGDNPEEIKKANAKMTNSLIGLVLLVGSFVIAGIIGYLIYGRADALLNPTIYGLGQ